MQQGFGGNFQGGNRNWGKKRNVTKRQNPPGFYPHNQQHNPRPKQEQKSTLEAIVEKFIVNQTKVNEEVGQALRNQQSMIQNLERTVGTIAKVLNERTNGELPPNTQVNPKDGDTRKIHINALTMPTKEVSESTSIKKTDNLHVVQVQPKKVPLREYHPEIPFPQRLRQVDWQLRKELNAAKGVQHEDRGEESKDS